MARLHGSRLAVLLAATAFIVPVTAGTAPVVAADSPACSERFPESSWNLLHSGSVTIEATGLNAAKEDRFLSEILLSDELIANEIGSYGVTMCVVSRESDFDATRYEEGSRRFHAHNDFEERLFVLGSEPIGFVAPAAAYGLAQHALWQNNGDSPFPEPIASVIGQWYRARILQRLDQYHRDVMFTNWFGTESIVDWTAREQSSVQNWDPETNFTAIGDFMEYAVTEYGTEVLTETDGDVWSEIEAGWRTSLRNDLRGRDTDTTDWIGGLALAIGALVTALIAAGAGIYTKRKDRDRAETPPPIPGFFSGT